MGKREDEYKLEDMVEYDEAYVTKASSSKQKRRAQQGMREPTEVHSGRNG